MTVPDYELLTVTTKFTAEQKKTASCAQLLQEILYCLKDQSQVWRSIIILLVRPDNGTAVNAPPSAQIMTLTKDLTVTEDLILCLETDHHIILDRVLKAFRNEPYFQVLHVNCAKLITLK